MRRKLWLFCMVAVGASCGETAAEVRRHTYAPSFHYLDEEQIRSSMGRLSTEVVELDRALRGGRAGATEWAGVGPGPVDTTDPDRVVAILTKMIRTADRLEAPALATNHPELGRNVEAFRRDLAAARASAAARPAQYFLAGTITGACLYCHSP